MNDRRKNSSIVNEPLGLKIKILRNALTSRHVGMQLKAKQRKKEEAMHFEETQRVVIGIIYYCIVVDFTFVKESVPQENIFRESELYNLILILIMYLAWVGYY